jgi:hypothetical protein
MLRRDIWQGVSQGFKGPVDVLGKVAAVTGDDLLDVVTSGNWPIEETGGLIADLSDRLLSANAYLGAAPSSLSWLLH